MSEKIWDGEERRKPMKHMSLDFEYLNNKVDSIYACLAREFGDRDLIGNKIEGNVTRQLRELNEKMTLQNGRVGKLEKRNIFLDGGVRIAGILFTSVIAILTVFVMWAHK